jgi:signal transduction histidine kinase
MSSLPRQPAESIRRRGSLLAWAFLAVAAIGLGVGAWQLARSQSHDRADLRNRYASRATVATALIDSIFRVAFTQQAQQAAQRFGGHVTTAQMAAYAKAQQQPYVAIVGSHGNVIAASPGAPAHPGASVINKGPLAVSDEMPFGNTKVIETATQFHGRDGQRSLVTASPVDVYRRFLSGTLQPLVPVEGGEAYILDSRGNVLAAVSAAHRGPETPAPQLIQDSARKRSGFYTDGGARYYASAPQRQTSWRIALSAPTSALYAPAGGVSRWLPWVVIGLLAIALLAITMLVHRAIAATGEVAVANDRLRLSQTRLQDRAVELQHANAELQRSNAELEQFAYVASHDLSAPLRAVAGFSQLLAVRYRGRLDASADEFINHMQEGVDRMQRIIDDLLAYSRVERSRLHAEPVELDSVLEEVLRSLEPDLAETGATISHDRLPQVRGDRGQLAQVLQNLIANGIKFSRRGVPPKVRVSAEAVGDRCRVSVADNGIGIDPADTERVFEMFHRLHGADEYPGTGIGLAICKKVVELHEGTIAARPGDDGGTVIVFDLPTDDPADRGARTAVATSSA